VKRYKTASETAEKNEEELKTEKRKLQREVIFRLTKHDNLYPDFSLLHIVLQRYC
jgi:hypothetical protein